MRRGIRFLRGLVVVGVRGVLSEVRDEVVFVVVPVVGGLFLLLMVMNLPRFVIPPSRGLAEHFLSRGCCCYYHVVVDEGLYNLPGLYLWFEQLLQRHVLL